MYKLYKYLDEVVGAYKDYDDGHRIVFTFSDPANTDYQAFLKHQAEGGKVYGADEEIPADEGTQ